MRSDYDDFCFYMSMSKSELVRQLMDRDAEDRKQAKAISQSAAREMQTLKDLQAAISK